MALKIRLRQQGRNNCQTFRLVVTDIRNKRDGKYLEKLGWYNPQEEENNSHVDGERVLHWIEKGAQLSHDAKMLLARSAPQVIKVLAEKAQQKKMKAIVKRRKAKKAAK